MNKLQEQFKFPVKKPDVPYNLHGWLGEGNQLLLKKYLNYETKLVIEFGSWLGLSADFILQNSNNKCKIICVDTWEGDQSIKKTSKFDKQLKTLHDTFLSNMWKWKDRVTPVKMDGRKAMKLISELGIKPDLIYLDMDHSYESAKGDLIELIKYFPDTLILGDDILYWKGVAQAVKEIMKEYKLTNLEINKNCYAIIPEWYTKKFQLKELRMKIIEPKEQYLEHRLAIIVGIHDKYYTKAQVERFILYMTEFMNKTNLEFKIFIIADNNKEIDINLGRLYNTGFQIAKNEKYNQFIMHDLHLLPHYDLLPFYKRRYAKAVRI